MEEIIRSYYDHKDGEITPRLVVIREVHQRTGTTGVPGTANDIFAAVKYVGANVIMLFQASSERSMCFVVREKEVKAVAMALDKYLVIFLHLIPAATLCSSSLTFISAALSNIINLYQQ
nr:bifunctional aspartokinase/homoserine dehydrogenase 1, chloroplastic-like [Tanacetum cinerariifolium]